ncbi:unnamed protein product, partial [Leptidea sinapis]
MLGAVYASISLGRQLSATGSTKTMGRAILENENFVPALVRFVSVDIVPDANVSCSEPYLGGCGAGAGSGAVGALQGVVSRLLLPRGPCGARRALAALAALWRPAAPPPRALDLHAALLRAAHSLLPALLPE